MEKEILIVSCALVVVGCYPVTQVGAPKLEAYQTFASSDTSKKGMFAAWKDFDSAADYCWTRSNNYEIRAKNAEFWRLGIGAGGGVMGLTGAMLSAAGTGGFAPAITAGLAGVASVALGNAEKGPLAPSVFIRERDGIASLIIAKTSEAQKTTDPDTVYTMAVALKQTCRSFPGRSEES